MGDSLIVLELYDSRFLPQVVCEGACVCVVRGAWMGSYTYDILSSASAEVVCHG